MKVAGETKWTVEFLESKNIGVFANAMGLHFTFEHDVPALVI